jgi:hypothetical protein
MEDWKNGMGESSGERISLRLDAKTFLPVLVRFASWQTGLDPDWNLTPAAVYQDGVSLGCFGHRHSPTGTAGVIRPDKGGELEDFWP